MNIAVIIPAFNEGQSMGLVLDDIPRDCVQRVIVVDNGSTDQTASVAQDHGADLVWEPRRGYGRACLRGMAALKNEDIVVFMDADYSDYPEEMVLLLEPILQDKADFVLGSRVLKNKGLEVLTPQAFFGNKLAVWLIRVFFRFAYTDLGPFRAIRYEALKSLRMCDQNYGWTVEMQIKAVRAKLRIQEIPVSYRQRIGTSKISGTLKGTICAGYKIIATILKYGLFRK